MERSWRKLTECVFTSSIRLCRRPRSSGSLSSRLNWRARLARFFNPKTQTGTDGSWLWLAPQSQKRHSVSEASICQRKHNNNTTATRLEWLFLSVCVCVSSSSTDILEDTTLDGLCSLNSRKLQKCGGPDMSA